jgi:thymidylate synthase (FAD)
MKVIRQCWEYVDSGESIKDMKKIEYAGRTCYNSTKKMTDNSYIGFINRAIESGHESILEHASISVKIITDRAVMAEITRHRLNSFSIESQRYVNYDDITFILPVWWEDLYDEEDQETSLSDMPKEWQIWILNCLRSESDYKKLIKEGLPPQKARVVLSNSVATTIITTANMRQWRTLLNLRCSDKAYPQIRNLCRDILIDFYSEYPPLFEDLYKKYIEENKNGERM